MGRSSPSTLVVITQVFPPDPAAVGAYLEDASYELVKRGWTLRVLAADRGYDDPSVRFPKTTHGEGIVVRRLPASSAGKGSLTQRLTGMIGFLLQAGLRALWQPDLAGILVSTSPPLAPGIATAVAWIRRVPVVFWAMDLNPQQAVAAGLLPPRAWSVRALGAAQRWVLRRAALTITLDSAMDRNLGREAPTSVRAVVPLWPRNDYLAHSKGFASTQAVGGDAGERLTLLYSGNHSAVHPLETVLLAAEVLRDDPRFRFIFAGGGRQKAAIQDYVVTRQLQNVILWPYQSPEAHAELSRSAHLHLVSFGDAMIGCVHPSKFYAALGVGKPVLLVGSARSPLAATLAEQDCGWRVDHGDVDAMVARLRHLLTIAGQQELKDKAAASARARDTFFDSDALRRCWADHVDQALCGGRRA